MSSVIILSYWWLDSGTHSHRCNFSSLQDQDVVFCNKGKNNRTFECLGTFYQTKDNSIIVLISDINRCLQNCVKGNHLYQEYNHKWFQILSSYLPATSPPSPTPPPCYILSVHPCVCVVWGIFDWLMIDDRLYSAILRSLEQTHCARMWCYMSDKLFIARFWISTEVVYLQRWHGWCHMKLQPFRRKFCVHHTTMHHVTSCKATYVRCMHV